MAEIVLGCLKDHGGRTGHESRLGHGSGPLSVWHTRVQGLGSARQRIGLASGLE